VAHDRMRRSLAARAQAVSNAGTCPGPQSFSLGSVSGMPYEVTRVASAARPTAVVAEATTWDAFPTLWPSLLREVRALLGDRSGLNVMLYQDDVPNVEVGVLVASSFVPSGRVTASWLPGGDVAMTVHRGPYEKLESAHRAVIEWCEAHGLALAGVRWEIYGHHEDDPAQRVTKVHYLLG